MNRSNLILVLITCFSPYVSTTTTHGGLRKFWGFPNIFGFVDEPTELIMFIPSNSIESKAMEPGVKKLEKRLKKKVLRLKLSNPRNNQLFNLISLNESTSGPLFYNRATGKKIIGPTTFKNLEYWALGNRKVKKYCSPIILNQKEIIKYNEEIINKKKKESKKPLKRKEETLEEQIDFNKQTGTKARLEKQLNKKNQTLSTKVAMFLVQSLLSYDQHT
mmetsp:Transcript_5388/g.7009  ORF Transcript_5388/g.7009 Transcript_5388/m.7009 type:complete len:218 (-) Transcript_5388:114-767(-)